MMKLVSPLRGKIPQIVAIVGLLILQAYCSLKIPEYTAKIVDVGIQNTDIPYIISTGSMMLAVLLIAISAAALVAFLSSRVSSAFAMDLRRMVYKKILNFSNHELNRISKSSLITRATNDITQIQNISEVTLTTIVFAPILGIGSVIKVFEIGSDLSWIVLIVFFIVLFIIIIFIKKVVPYFEIFQKIADEINKNSREILIGMPVIKAFVRQDFEEEKFDRTNRKLLGLTLFIYKVSILIGPLLTLILDLMIVAIIYFGAFEAVSGGIMTGEIISFIQYATQIISAFLLIGSFMITLPRIVISGKRVNEILETEISIRDGEIDSIDDNSAIEFRDVTYQYPESERETIKNINLKLEVGKTTAIIGGTGSGKSTILNLIPRLQDPTSGEILIGGKNIKNYTLRALRNKICFTPQNSVLLHGTVRSNMLIAKKDATDEEIEKALENAHVDFIDTIDDEVAQGGVNFSGGQKQRLSIARSFLNPSDFYLFDDCFSALDMNTERIIKDNLKNSDSSILIVSQRISTIRDADEIIVLEKGEIIDSGTHEKLVESCDVYREIVDSQTDTLGGI